MSQGIGRSIVRWIHIVVSIPILGYIYSPFDKIPQYASPTRFIFLSDSWSFRDCGCGKAIPSTTCFETTGLTRTIAIERNRYERR